MVDEYMENGLWEEEEKQKPLTDDAGRDGGSLSWVWWRE